MQPNYGKKQNIKTTPIKGMCVLLWFFFFNVFIGNNIKEIKILKRVTHNQPYIFQLTF